ncbi:hypothetical protein GOBAR_AA33254 [Gossypium barbadense]|uniref:Uncharacterized protein n=1 Tax=Gossypium barbadense TaxID=3634 RepID=A0A2P5W8P7_GOSBA|nr:hypothetical protein GOBAR_AA33254 [Gossypium barbadense]
MACTEYQPFNPIIEEEQVQYMGQGNQRPPPGYQQPPYQQEKKPNLEEMLTKFISVSETRFQNTETALKNQQASIQGLKTQIGQLPKLISKQPQGSLPKGVVEAEPKSRQEIVVRKGNGEVDYNKNKPVTVEYKPCVPYPNETRKDRSDEQFGELTFRVGDETITLQARNSSNTSEIEGDRLNHSTKTNNMVQPTLEELSLKEAHELFSSNSRGPTHEERRLQIDELDEWRTHKPRTHNKPKLRQNELDTFPNQLKVGDKVLLDTVDPHIVTVRKDEEIPLTVLRIFPFSTVEVSHPKFGTFKVNNTHLKPYFDDIDSKNEEYKLLKPL